MLCNEKCTTTFFKVVLEQSSIRERIPSMAFLDGSIGMPQTARSDVACSKDNKLKLALIHVQLACKWHQTLLGGVSCTPVHGNIAFDSGSKEFHVNYYFKPEERSVNFFQCTQTAVLLPGGLSEDDPECNLCG
uniref:HDC09396 n=1 Tax=Drosophila melanogaster TaxID=7227 RepID=Q6ILI7_DROME|nr:TPA_inf: HDC09396 [Drosophila melanogaster]